MGTDDTIRVWRDGPYVESERRIECPECDREVPLRAEICPHCDVVLR